MQPFKAVGVRADFLESQNHVMRGAAPFYMGGGSLGSWLYQAYGAPWLKDDPNQRLKTITESEYSALVTAERNGGAITRFRRDGTGLPAILAWFHQLLASSTDLSLSWFLPRR